MMLAPPSRLSAARGLRPRCGLRSVLAACLPSAPKGLPWSSYYVKEIKPETQKRCLACGASRHIVLHRMSERREPVAVKAKPFGRVRGLDGFEAGPAA